MTHRFVTIEQVIRAERPAAEDLETVLQKLGLTNSTQEAIWVIALDNMEMVKTITEVARGGFHDVLVYPKNILAAVLAAQTDRFYIAHNHPSGPVTPTTPDMGLTVDVMKAANAVGMSFEDHIITGPEGWFSFFDQGLLTRATVLGFQGQSKKRAAEGGRR